MLIKKNILDLADNYDTFFIDLFGTVYDGSSFYDGVLDRLSYLKGKGKKIVILSNSSSPKEVVIENYQKKFGFSEKYYDCFITSYEFLRQDKSFQNKKIMDLFVKNEFLRTDLKAQETFLLDDADFLYAGVIKAEQKQINIADIKVNNTPVGFGDLLSYSLNQLTIDRDETFFKRIYAVLAKAQKRRIPLIIPNPDFFAGGHDGPKQIAVLTQGTIGYYFEKMGGKVLYYGKPYASIFEYAKKISHSAADKIAMVGDNPATDVFGAKLSNIDSIFVLTGISQNYFGEMGEISLTAKLAKLFQEINRKIVNFAEFPTHICERF